MQVKINKYAHVCVSKINKLHNNKRLACPTPVSLHNTNTCRKVIYLSFPVDADDPGRSLVWSRDEDCVATDTVHVDTRTRLDVVQMNVAILCDDVDHVVFVTNLKIRHI